jgi:type II secretory pathway predicted ATPase ExeA
MQHPALGYGQSPFGDTADPDMFYPSRTHQAACTELFAAVKALAGLIVLTGEPGTGKTTVLRRVIRDVEGAGGRGLWCSMAASLDATVDATVASLVRQRGIPDSTTPEGQREALLTTLRADAPQGGVTVVAVDEAQRLDRAELENLRALAEAGTASGTRLAVLLVGEPELDVELESLGWERGTPAYVRVVLSRLAASEVGPYVACRLGQAGARHDVVFQSDAIEGIAARAEGIPRVINQLCDAALRTASQADITMVSAPIVDAAARWVALPFPDRTAVHGAQPVGARQMNSGRSRVRAWSTGAGVAALVLVGAVLFALRLASQPPPPPSQVAAPAQVEAPQRPAVAPNPGIPMPAEMAHGAPPMPPAPGRVVEQPSDSGGKPAREPSARVGRRGGTPPRMASQAPAPSAARRMSPVGSALLDNAEAGNLREVQALLAAGVPPQARDARGMTPLMVAVIHDHGAVAEVLLARGADVNAWDDGGVTALMLAANNGRAALLQRLLGRGAQVNSRSRAGWTALTYAAWKGHASVVRRLLAAGADPRLTDRIGWTALQYATWRVADVTRAGVPDPAHLLAPEDPELAEAARLRYTEVVSVLSGATRKR